MPASTKTINVYLQPGTSIHKSMEIIASKAAGWQIVLIIPHGKNERGELKCEVQMLRMIDEYS